MLFRSVTALNISNDCQNSEITSTVVGKNISKAEDVIGADCTIVGYNVLNNTDVEVVQTTVVGSNSCGFVNSTCNDSVIIGDTSLSNRTLNGCNFNNSVVIGSSNVVLTDPPNNHSIGLASSTIIGSGNLDNLTSDSDFTASTIVGNHNFISQGVGDANFRSSRNIIIGAQNFTQANSLPNSMCNSIIISNGTVSQSQMDNVSNLVLIAPNTDITLNNGPIIPSAQMDNSVIIGNAETETFIMNGNNLLEYDLTKAQEASIIIPNTIYSYDYEESNVLNPASNIPVYLSSTYDSVQINSGILPGNTSNFTANQGELCKSYTEYHKNTGQADQIFTMSIAFALDGGDRKSTRLNSSH